MKKELSISQIYNDFTSKVTLTHREKEVLDKYIKDESITKMSLDLSLGTATVSRIISDIKEKYDKYKKLEIAKLMLLK